MPQGLISTILKPEARATLTTKSRWNWEMYATNMIAIRGQRVEFYHSGFEAKNKFVLMETNELKNFRFGKRIEVNGNREE